MTMLFIYIIGGILSSKDENNWTFDNIEVAIFVILTNLLLYIPNSHAFPVICTIITKQSDIYSSGFQFSSTLAR